MIIVKVYFLFMCTKTKNIRIFSGISHNSVTEIAQAIQVSISVVSKVMNHQGGVHADQRYRVYRYLSDHAIAVPTPANVEIYAILPDTPVFFWREISSFLKKECFSLQDKVNLYSSISANQENEYLIIKYLEHARNCGAFHAQYPYFCSRKMAISQTTGFFLSEVMLGKTECYWPNIMPTAILLPETY